MDFTIKPTNSTPALTVEVAQLIYNSIVLNGNADLAFKAQSDSSLEPEHFPLVDKEGMKIMNEIQSKFNGSFLLEAKIPATYDEEGEILTEEVPAVYYQVTTETVLKNSLSSDMLDTDIVYNDFKGSKTFTELKAQE